MQSNCTSGQIYDSITARIASCSDPANRIPSWSWASTQDGVSWSSNKRAVLHCIEVLEIAYTIIGPDISDEIQDAGVTLRLPLICFDCMRVEPSLAGVWSEFASHHHKLDDRQASHCTESAASGEIVYRHLYWDNAGFGTKSSK